MGFEVFAEGTLTANGTEQTLAELTESVRVSGYVDLSKLQAGDTVVIRQYIKLFASYKQYYGEVYSGVQTEPMVYVQSKEIASSTKITLQQTGGTYRTFDYKFIKDKESIEIVVKSGGFRV